MAMTCLFVLLNLSETGIEIQALFSSIPQGDVCQLFSRSCVHCWDEVQRFAVKVEDDCCLVAAW